MLRDWGVAVLIGVAVFFAVDALSKGADRRGDEAPAFELQNAAGGTVKLADYAGKTVVLNFWGSWCGPCVGEIPEFAAWSADHPDVPILGISYRSGAGGKLERDARRLGVTWPVLEADASVLAGYGVDVFPTTFVVGPDGLIHGTAKGAIDADALGQLVASAK
jgi:hypothetical protein